MTNIDRSMVVYVFMLYYAIFSVCIIGYNSYMPDDQDVDVDIYTPTISDVNSTDNDANYQSLQNKFVDAVTFDIDGLDLWGELIVNVIFFAPVLIALLFILISLIPFVG